MTVRDSVQNVLDLDRQLQEKKQTTITELLSDRQEIDAALKALGFDGTLPKKKAAAQIKPKEPCKVCQSPDHDGRFHRRKEVAPPPVPKAEKPVPPQKTPPPPPAK